MALEKDVREDEEKAESDNERDKERNADFLDFRRKMDEFKGATEGMSSESDKMKAQGNAYFSFGCYSQATIMYSDAIELNPHNAVLYCNRAMAYLKQEMPELALADALKSLQIDATVVNVKAYWRKAQALFDLNSYEESEAAASDGLEVQPRNPQLNKVRRKAREATVTNLLVAGDWVGKSNGLEQRLSFTKEGGMTMTVFGHRMPSTYELSVEGNPRSMLVKMQQQLGPGSAPPVPPMVYIFEFHDDNKELWMCHPVDGSKDLPTKFEGPGLVKARRVAAEVDPAASTEPVEKRCVDYMKEMNKVMPLMPAQLPEKPDDEQIREEVELCARVSELKRKYGAEAHQRAVDLAKSPSTAESQEVEELAQQLRLRFIARRLLKDEPKVQDSQPAPEAAQTTRPAPPEVVPEQPSVCVQAPVQPNIKKESFLSCLAGICGKN